MCFSVQDMITAIESINLNWFTENYNKNCPYLKCIKARDLENKIPFQSAMQLCPTCGNKRYPKGTDCVNTCTDSNDVRQTGSSY